jgi:hypothetical protein
MRIERVIDLADPVKEPELPAHIRAGASLWALPRFDKARRYEHQYLLMHFAGGARQAV